MAGLFDNTLPRDTRNEYFFAVWDPTIGDFQVWEAVPSRGQAKVTLYGTDGTALLTSSNPARTKEVGGTPVDGTLAATTTGAALGTQACIGVFVQNDPDNTVDILIGDATNQRYQLVPGQGIYLPVSNVNLVFGKTASGTGSINWIAIT